MAGQWQTRGERVWAFSDGPGKASLGSCSEYYVYMSLSPTLTVIIKHWTLDYRVMESSHLSDRPDLVRNLIWKSNFSQKSQTSMGNEDQSHENKHWQSSQFIPILLFLTMKLYVHSSLELFPDQDHFDISGDSLPYKIVNQAKQILLNIILLIKFSKCVQLSLDWEGKMPKFNKKY